MQYVYPGMWYVYRPVGRGKARGAEFVRGAHRETELRKKLKPTQPANSSVRPWKGGVPIYKVQFGGGANYLLASNTRTAPVHADRKATQNEDRDQIEIYHVVATMGIYSNSNSNSNSNSDSNSNDSAAK